MRRIAMLFFGWIEDPEKRLPIAADGTEFQMINSCAGHDFFGPPLQILNRHVLNVLPQELFAVSDTGEEL